MTAAIGSRTRTDNLAPRQAGRNAAELRAQERAEQWMLGGLAVPGLVLIGIVALAPIVWLFWLSFRDADGMTLAHYARMLHPSYLITLVSTFELSFLVTIICILLGYPLAYVIAQARPASPRCCCFLYYSRSGPRCWCAATHGSSCCNGAGS